MIDRHCLACEIAAPLDHCWHCGEPTRPGGLPYPTLLRGDAKPNAEDRGIVVVPGDHSALLTRELFEERT